MDVESLDDYFSEFSESILAILAGVVIIITIWFFIEAVIPLWSDNSILLIYAFVLLFVGVIAPIAFYISELTLWPDLVGKLITGITGAIFLVLIIQVITSHDSSKLPEIVFSGLLGLSSSLLLTRGVLVPLLGTETYLERSETFEEGLEETEESDHEEQIERDFEPNTEGDEEEILDGKKFPEEENEPW